VSAGGGDAPVDPAPFRLARRPAWWPWPWNSAAGRSIGQGALAPTMDGRNARPCSVRDRSPRTTAARRKHPAAGGAEEDWIGGD